MSYKDLLNSTCKITRIPTPESGSENIFGEPTDDPAVIGDVVPCRLEKLYDRELVEAYAGGDHDKGIYVLYLKIRQNVRASDNIEMLETVKINGFGTVAVNGLYKRSEDTVVNDKPTYELAGTDYRIYFNVTEWVLEDTDTPQDMYKTSDTNLQNKTWVEINGTEPNGKSILNSVPDFENNTTNDPNNLIVMDVEDAGGGHNHHLQCFCRYRKEIQ